MTLSFEKNLIIRGHKILSLKTRVLEATHSKDFMILGVAVLIQCQGVTDKWTDGQTDTSIMAKTHKALHVVARKN